ncbi:MAG TPA: hypothetical protein VIG80_05405 [Bacillaceae bacterium]
MGAITAQILIGKAHANDGGINPEYQMFLSENSAPVWLLKKLDIFSRKDSDAQTIKWIPTVEHMLEDAVLMIGLYAAKDKQLLQMESEYFNRKEKGITELYRDVTPSGLEMLRRRARQLEHGYKITLSIFYGSSIRSQTEVLKEYKTDVEVCMPVYAREYSVWSKQVEEKGKLEVPADRN